MCVCVCDRVCVCVRVQLNSMNNNNNVYVYVYVDMKSYWHWHFTIFFSMLSKQAMKDLDGLDGVYIWYRLDGSLFNLWQLQAHTNTLNQLIWDHCFIDDAALTAHTDRAL